MSKAQRNFGKSPKARITKVYVEGRLELLDRMWMEFTAGHKDLMYKFSSDELKDIEYVEQDMFEQTEEVFVTYKTELKTILSTFEPKPNALNDTLGVANTLNNPLTSTAHVRLPKISISKFSGRYSEWSTFRDLFQSLIHHNATLDNVQKLHYLKGYLTGEAEQLIRHIPISEVNYDRCWEMLEDRYNNKKYLSQNILKRLLGQRTIVAESASGLKELLDTTNDCLSALNNLKVDTKGWDILVIYIISLKLDSETRRQWEFYIINKNTSDELPTYDQFKEFLTNRYRAIEFLDAKPQINRNPHYNNNNTNYTNTRVKTLHVMQEQCSFCSGEHKLTNCKEFDQNDLAIKFKFIQDNRICFNCLGSGHMARDCKNTIRCKECRRKHSTMLHPGVCNVAQVGELEAGIQEEVEGINHTSNENGEGTSDQVVTCFSRGRVVNQVLLATAVVGAKCKTGKFIAIRALLDQGSQASFVTEATVQQLGLKKHPVKGAIAGIGGGVNLVSTGTVDIQVKSRVNAEITFAVRAHVIKCVTSLLPTKRVTIEDWLELGRLELADPSYHTPNRIDMLLGAETYSRILREGIKRDPQGNLVAQCTSLGWILSGTVDAECTSSLQVMHCYVEESDLLRRFWELESDISGKRILTEEERLCEEYYAQTTRRDEDGRYIVRIPLKVENPEVIGSKRIAERRFKTLEKRFLNDAKLHNKYREVVKEYETLNHMEEVREDERHDPKAVYLPHHAVIREDRDTTKVRVVFDASCKGENNVSINNAMLIGPTLQSSLWHLILRWRSHRICLVADIVKMYRQVTVEKEDRRYQRILWREKPTDELKHYQLRTVTFGTASAPYLAVKTLQQVATDEAERFPRASKIVKEDFYVDDLLTGAETVEEAEKIFVEATELLSTGCFELQKWTSNSKVFLDRIMGTCEGTNEEEKAKDLNLKLENVQKILGLTWCRDEDTFKYTVKLPELQEPVTKRKVIANISRFYDPMGWMGPSTIISKIMIQKLWLAGIDWDQVVPEHLLKEWSTYRQELKQLTEISIPRWTHIQNGMHVELHGFCDASKVAYAAVVYIRVVQGNGTVKVSLATGKTKVAPVKQVSIPRLELCGAVLLTRLIIEVAKELKVENSNVFAWTDSTVVLAWINSHPSRWKVFVANRTSEILESLGSQNWHHVSSSDNPADSASRGLRPSELVNNALWFSGPQFLKERTIGYVDPDWLNTDLEQVKVAHHIQTKESICERFSSLSRLIRVAAYCKRFINNANPKTTNYAEPHLTTIELSNCLNYFIKECQAVTFDEDMKYICKNENLPKSSKIRSLNPFFDKCGLLRAGGRLGNSDLSFGRKHPIIIPKQSWLTTLIVADAHKKTLHGGVQLMLSYLQSAYWIIGVKQAAKAVCRKCVVCVKNAAMVKVPLMGQLPAARSTPARAFYNSGVDYAGPIQIRTTKGRGHKAYKGYICLFVCMSTRAVHLEAVSDLTTEGFLQAFKRFVARRGHCANMWSDNGTNFMGAERELQRLLIVENKGMNLEIAKALATRECNWHFIPPKSPNFGGLWEAGVKSVKHHLRRVIGNTTLTYEELATVLTQIEACLNSRPLSVLSNGTNGLTVITPGHFLIGEPLVTIPDRNFEPSNGGSLRRWQHTQKLLQHFWRQWSQEYLHKFVQRHKWSVQNPQPKPGDVVLIKEDNLPPCKWLYGKLLTTHPGTDGIVRVVTLRTGNSVIKRPVNKLCILPISD